MQISRALGVVVFVAIVTSGRAQMTDAFRTTVLNDHNTLRRTLVTASNMIELTWDSNLETVAQDFVNAATSGGHNSARTTQYAALGGSGYVGENWYSGSPSDAAVKWATFVWPVSWGGNGCSEQQNYWATYELSTNGQSHQSCAGGTVGHYTQVLWATSARLGCGYRSGIGTICNYAPGGNVGGYTNYVQSGTACSACPSGYDACVNGLCSSGSAAPTTTTTSAPTDNNNLGATDTTTPNPTASPTSISPTQAPTQASTVNLHQTITFSSTLTTAQQETVRSAYATLLTSTFSSTASGWTVTISAARRADYTISSTGLASNSSAFTAASVSSSSSFNTALSADLATAGVASASIAEYLASVSSSEEDSSGGLSGGTIAIVVFFVLIVVVGLIVAVVAYFMLKRQKMNTDLAADIDLAPPASSQDSAAVC